MAPRNGDEERRVITVALLSRRRPPAGKPPTTADRKVTKSSTGHPRTAPAPCRTKPAAGMSRGRPGRRSMSRWIGPACAWAVGNGSPRQGTEEPRCHTRIFQERRAIGMLTQSAVSIGTASRPRRRKRRSTRRSRIRMRLGRQSFAGETSVTSGTGRITTPTSRASRACCATSRSRRLNNSAARRSRRLPPLRSASRDRPLITRNRLRGLLPQLGLGGARTARRQAQGSAMTCGRHRALTTACLRMRSLCRLIDIKACSDSVFRLRDTHI